MELPRYRISRQTVCRQCSSAKARCDRGFEGSECARCNKRRLPCSHIGQRPISTGANTAGSPESQETQTERSWNTSSLTIGIAEIAPAETVIETGNSTEAGANVLNGDLARPSQKGASDPGKKRLSFSNLDLICPIDADGISNRWLKPYIPSPGQQAKAYDPTVASFIHRILKSYASLAVHVRGIPPFVHPMQLEAGENITPLETCLNVVRLLERSTAGSNTSVDLLKREMDQIYESRNENGTTTGLAAYQAYLIYSLTLYFFAGSSANTLMVQSMIQLQEIASITAKQGIVCSAEQRLARPKWGAWIIAESKRRAIYTMYLFDGLLSARDGLPSFLGTELQGLHAPACQCLWGAKDTYDWERKYNIFLAQWPEEYLTTDELWPTPPEFNSAQITRRQARVDQWLEDVDNFGTMLYAVTSYIHKN